MFSKEFIQKIKLPAILLTVLIFPLAFGQYVPINLKSLSYAISLSMKTTLEFVLPFIIFSFIFSCLINLQKGAMLFVLLLIVCVFCSNFTALMFGYLSGSIGVGLLHLKQVSFSQDIHLIPTWSFHLKKFISNDTALLIGFISGTFFSFFPNNKIKSFAQIINTFANVFLRRIFIPVLPLFILGFMFKLEHEQILQSSLKIYGPILILLIITQWIYLTIWYSIASKGSIKKLLFYIKNVLPASLTGLSTISSAASMPVLLISTEKNLGDSEKAKMLVPAIINIHTVGSAIGIPILSLATLSTFGYPMPSFSMFLVFAFYTALAKYAVAAVPGGVIIVVAPILEAHLGFTPDMIGLITAVYMICDPFGTTANVTGNGAFPILFTRLYEKLKNIRAPKLVPNNIALDRTKTIKVEAD